jgi:hypothetical protein
VTHHFFRKLPDTVARPGRMLLVAGLIALSAVVVAGALPRAAAARPPLNAYRGLGIWVDMYDAAAWNAPAAAVKDMASHHVRTLFIETSNYHWPTAVNKPPALAAIIQACHARGLRVVAWYLPGFKDQTKDYQRSMAAIDYRTPDGQKFDSFALDIESSLVKSVSTRNTRLANLSARIRRAVGSRYTLGGIIPSPAGMRDNATYWPKFPYKTVAKYYNVIVPMGYYTYHGDGYASAYRDTRDNVSIVRAQTGRPGIPIHVIAGLASASSGTETLAYVRALRENGCLGGSMYDWPTTNAADWKALANVRTNPRQKVALPVDIGYAAPLGNLPGEHSHPKEVFYQAPAQDGQRVLRFRVYGVQTHEVRLLVNWHVVAVLKAGPSGAWSGTHSVRIPAAALHASSRNVIGFVARGAYPKWHVWGVRDVALVAP